MKPMATYCLPSGQDHFVFDEIMLVFKKLLYSLKQTLCHDNIILTLECSSYLLYIMHIDLVYIIVSVTI